MKAATEAILDTTSREAEAKLISSNAVQEASMPTEATEAATVAEDEPERFGLKKKSSSRKKKWKPEDLRWLKIELPQPNHWQKAILQEVGEDALLAEAKEVETQKHAKQTKSLETVCR